MNLTEVNQRLIENPSVRSTIGAIPVLPDIPGYYSIWAIIDSSLPPSFRGRVIDCSGAKYSLLYIGIATKSLRTRLGNQELQHKSPATFFRSIGAILGYSPISGSLPVKSKSSNYKFSASDTTQIVNWIQLNLRIAWIGEIEPKGSIEVDLIRKHAPPLNIKHNPKPVSALRNLRAKCRSIARGN
ncbi:MAG: hypothetical protein ACI8TQ_000002 [Planctomycetota bacterium]|jgi:hypothetical protein